jgi:DNA polymerase III subunit beta
MQVEVLQENLNKALQSLVRVIPSRPSLPVLSCIHFDATEAGIICSATDLFIGMTTVIPGKVTEPGTIDIPAKVFAELVTSLLPGKVTLSLKENSLKIDSQNTHTSLQCFQGGDFPEFPSIEGSEWQLSTAFLEGVLAQVAFSASSDVTRPVLTGVLFEPQEGSLRVVATDGFRLALMDGPGIDGMARILVPTKALAEVARLARHYEQDHVTWKWSEEQKQLLVSIGPATFFIRVIDGSYPPYEKIMPTLFTLEVTVDAEELTQHLKRALILARDSSYIVQFSFKNQQLTVSATSAAAGQHESMLPVMGLTDEQVGDIAFNARYVLEFLQALPKGEKEVVFKMNESLKPAQFSPKNSPATVYVVMPFRTTTTESATGG